ALPVTCSPPAVLVCHLLSVVCCLSVCCLSVCCLPVYFSLPPRALSSDVLVISYGSLLSGLGLEPFGHLRVRGAARVALLNARRGFGKISQHGDRFAMVLEADYTHQPIE